MIDCPKKSAEDISLPSLSPCSSPELFPAALEKDPAPAAEPATTSADPRTKEIPAAYQKERANQRTMQQGSGSVYCRAGIRDGLPAPEDTEATAGPGENSGKKTFVIQRTLGVHPW